MKKLILCIFSLCVITFLSPIKAFASYPVSSADVHNAIANVYVNENITGKYAVFYSGSEFFYFQWPSSVDTVTLNGSNTGINFYVYGRYTDGSLGGFANNHNDLSSILYNWLSSGTVTPLGGTVTVNFKGSEIVTPDPPPPSSPDGFFLSKDGASLLFGVYCTENSAYMDVEGMDKPPFYYTQNYTFRISADGFDHYEVPSLQYWRYLSSVPQVSNASDFITKPLTFYASAIYNVNARALKCYIGGLLTDTTYPLTDCRSVNRISLRQLATALNADKLSAVCTEITVSAQDVNGNTVWSDSLDFSTLSPSSIPSADPSEPDQTKTPDVLNQWMYSQQNLLNELIKGQPYDKPPLNTSIGDYSISDLHAITSPDVTLEQVPLDSRPLGWFTSFVEWWYSSPFGLIALASLTFLIIRTIIW